MSTVGILGRTVLNTALGSRQGQEEVSLQNRTSGRMGRGGEQSRHRDSWGQLGTAGDSRAQVCRAPALKATAELFCFCWKMRQRHQWGRCPVSNMVKSLGVMLGVGLGMAKAPAGCCGGGGGGTALPGAQQGAGGFYRCFTSLFCTIKTPPALRSP